MVKSGAAATVNWAVLVCLVVPLVPVTVRVEVPAGVLAAVVTVMVELPERVTEAGLKDALAPVGKPVAARLIVPVVAVIVTV
jgi:hypothetical protein